MKYNKKISGPLLDRIDLHIQVPRLKYEQFKIDSEQTSSAQLRSLVEQAREIQHQRFKSAKTNSEMSRQDLKFYCQIDLPAEQLLKQASDKYLLSGRSINRLLKVARTIADLEGSKNIQQMHLAESLQYRLNN